LGVDQAHVVGRSMGGAVAQHMALLAPERIQSLALLASFARLDPVGRRVLTNMRQVLEWTGSWEAHAKHSVPNFVSTRFFNEQPDAVARIEALIGGGGRDPICSPTATEWLGAIPGSETVMFEGSSHFFLLEEPERFLETLLG